MHLKFNYYWLAALIPGIFICWFILRHKEDKPLRYLNYYGPKRAMKANDTAYFTVPDFEFTDQYSEKINGDSVKDKIYVTEYFFTTCKSICPIMNSNLDHIYKHFKNRKDFLILSHTVDPETDSVPVLKAYADIHSVKDRKWLFVTGSKQKLYELARKGYLLNAEEGNGGEEDFIHTQNFALVDKEKHIRGFYDGTDSLEINRLIQDLNLLFKEYEYKERASH